VPANAQLSLEDEFADLLGPALIEREVLSRMRIDRLTKSRTKRAAQSTTRSRLKSRILRDSAEPRSQKIQSNRQPRDATSEWRGYLLIGSSSYAGMTGAFKS
jgi:hypothetical protein